MTKSTDQPVAQRSTIPLSRTCSTEGGIVRVAPSLRSGPESDRDEALISREVRNAAHRCSAAASLCLRQSATVGSGGQRGVVPNGRLRMGELSGDKAHASPQSLASFVVV